MYLALRDIRFAKGRFLLMGSVVSLISLLLVMLSGLTAGLAERSTSAIESLNADAIAFADNGADDDGGADDGDAEPSYTDSQVTSSQLEAWQESPSLSAAEPLGITQTQLEAEGTTTVAVFGAEPGGDVLPAPLSEGEAVISEEVAQERNLQVGDEVQISSAELSVTQIIDDQWYSHSPVVWTSLTDWQELSHLGDEDTIGTVIVASHEDAGSDPTGSVSDHRDETDAAAGTVSMSTTDSFSALASFSSENGSLMMMQGFLYGISALVIIAFLSVWTVQRTRDIAVLRALGASAKYVLKDAIAQAAVVLAAGALLGGALGVLGGMIAGQAAPFITDISTTVVPISGLVALGLLGAVLAVRRAATVDPMIALGGN